MHIFENIFILYSHIIRETTQVTDKSRKTTKVTKVLENIRQDISAGNFTPNEKLQMDHLKERYGVGYSPIREALSRLVTHGLVHLEDQCGFKVASLSIDELHDLYQIRILIETHALALSIQHGDDQWEADILAGWHRYEKQLTHHQLSPTEWDQLQREFSFNLVKACQSPWLLKIRDVLYDQSERYRSLCLNTLYQDKNFLKNFIKEKERVVKAVIARDKNQAIALIKQSWESSIKIVEKILKNKNH